MKELFHFLLGEPRDLRHDEAAVNSDLRQVLQLGAVYLLVLPFGLGCLAPQLLNLPLLARQLGLTGYATDQNFRIQSQGMLYSFTDREERHGYSEYILRGAAEENVRGISNAYLICL